MDKRIDQAVLWVLSAAVLVLSFIMMVELRTNPSDVLREVKEHNSKTMHALEAIEENMRVVQSELDRRGVWMEGIDDELQSRTKDRIFRSQVVRWRGELVRLNKGKINVPELPE